MNPPRWKLIVAFAAIYLIWGSTYLAIRYAIETLPPLLMAGCRFLVAGSLLYGFERLRGARPPERKHWRAALIIGGLLLLGGNGAVVWAEQRVPSGQAALLIATEPLWIVLLQGRLPGRWLAAGLALGLGGMALLVGPQSLAGGGQVDLVGGALLLVATFCWAAGSLYARTASMPDAPRLATAMQMLAGGALLLVGGAATGELHHFALAAVSLRSLLAFGYLVVFGSLIAFTAYNFLVRNAAPSQVATYAYVNPVVAVLLGWLVAGEPLTTRTLLAAGAIVAGVVVITARSR